MGCRQLTQDRESARDNSAVIVFFDDPSLSLTPNVRRVQPRRTQTPVTVHPFD